MQTAELGSPTPMTQTTVHTTGAADQSTDTSTLWDWPAEIPHMVDTIQHVGLEIDIAVVTT